MLRRAQIIFLLAALLGGAGAARAQEQTGEFFNPYLAEKNFEVGEFYLKRKNYDAAIERLLDAIRYKANHARAHLLLGEAFEKKGELQDAIVYYEKYLEILPSAKDAGKVRKRIAEVKKRIEKREKRKKSEGRK